MIHKAVLLGEAIENLNLVPGMTVVDATLGAGGHSTEILKKILPGGKLVSIDWDRRAVQEFESLLKEKGIAVLAKKKITVRLGKTQASSGPTPKKSNANGEVFPPMAFTPLFSGDKIVGYWCGVNDNYANLDIILAQLKIDSIDAIIADLGFSSDQIENIQRGFSFLRNGPLDMRYSEKTALTARDIVNWNAEEKLAEIFKVYGEERYARKIAGEIVKSRKSREIKTTQDLVEIIEKAVPAYQKKGNMHFATRVFQALRIEVNQELENLKIFLEKAAKLLKNGGRVGIISFHSLEDRIVKKYFQQEARNCVCPENSLKCSCSHRKTLRIVTKKPIVSSEREYRQNPRCRSAKLRVGEKI